MVKQWVFFMTDSFIGLWFLDMNKTSRPEYAVWCEMKARCLRKSHVKYTSYGGRGIAVCDKWLAFNGFFEDIGERPSSLHQIDRIDNNKGYFKENCQWATTDIQARNRRSNIMVELNGVKMTVIDAIKITGIKQSTVYARINRFGWTPERAVTQKWGKNVCVHI